MANGKKLEMIDRLDTARRHFFSFIRHNTLRKTTNLLLAEWERKIGKTALKSRPYMIKIDPISLCNLSCPGCPSAYNSRTGNNGKMALSLFKKIIDELKPYLYKISLYAWGEPLLNKEIYQMIRYANQNNVGAVVSSNMNAFSEWHAEQMVESGLEHLIVAVDGATQETYARYRVGGKLERVISNLELLQKTKQKHRSKLPLVEMQFLLNGENDAEIPAIQALAQKVAADRLTFKSFYVEETSRAQSPIIQKRKQKCHWLWGALVILWDGSVTPCCFKNSKPVVGSVVDNTIASIYNGPTYVKSRALFNGAPHPEGANQECTYCNLFA